MTDFTEQWRDQLPDSLAEAARLAPLAPDIDLKYELLAVGVVWPLREPVKQFDVAAMRAVQALVGERAKHIFKLVQPWPDDRLAAARALAGQERPAELEAALKTLIAHFGAFPIFATQLASQARATEQIKQIEADAPPEPPQVFVFAMQSDGQSLAGEVRGRLEAEGISLGPDLTPLEGEPTWWQEVQKILSQVTFLVLAMTPAAMSSELVRRQWRTARQQGVCIYPVFKTSDLDFSQLPRWIRQIHFYNLNLEWPKLLRDLKGECQAPRSPFMVEELPYFVLRPAELASLRAHFFDSQREEALIATVGLHGAGGYGKSTLARALGHDENIRQIFDNGILWVTLGEEPGDLRRYIIDLIEVLSGERPGFTGLEAAVGRLGELLADRDLLMIIDDVWNTTHLRPFLAGGPRCARLITTRDVTTLPAGAKTVAVGAMQPPEAMTLLTQNLPEGAAAQEMARLADRLGQWPLLLKLTNGVLHDRLEKQQESLRQAVAYVNHTLDQRGLVAFDQEDGSARNQAVSQTIGVSLDLLAEAEQTRYAEMAIFPEDVDIPLAGLELLWGATGGLDDFDTEDLCDHLHELSLVAHIDLTSRYVRLHRAMRSYLLHQVQPALPQLHRSLLAARRATLDQWADLPPEESYFWTYLTYHLVEADQIEELRETVKDLRYLATKIKTRGVYYAESDLESALAAGPEEATEDEALLSLRRSLAQHSHILSRCQTPRQIANALHSRLIHLPALAESTAQAEQTLPRPLLTARHRLPDLPAASLIRTLRGHSAGVLACALSGDGQVIASVAKDNVLTVWRAETGQMLFSQTGATAEIWCMALNADGSTLALGLSDGQAQLWDTETQSLRHSWTAHQAGGVLSCALTAGGERLVTSSKDQTVKLWDTARPTELLSLPGHDRTVTDCGISADGQLIVSAANDGQLKIWEGQSGAERFSRPVQRVKTGLNRLTFFKQRDINFNCALSGDGRVAVGSSAAGAVVVWDLDSGQERFSLTTNGQGVAACALNADGSRLVCAFNNGRLKLWDSLTGAELLTLAAHRRAVNSCAISANGELILSASDDQTLNLWDSRAETAALAISDYSQAAHSCALDAQGAQAVTAMADQTLKLWRVKEGAVSLTLKGHTRKINGCALTPDGAVLVSASQDQTLIVWDARSGAQLQTLAGHSWGVNSCAISPDGATVVSASDDKTLKVWQVESGEELFTLSGHSRTVSSCALDVRGETLVSASGDGTLKIWQPQTGVERFTLKGHSAWVNSCAISADGRTVLSGSYDKTLKVWVGPDYEARHTLRGHTATLTGCALSADGALAVSTARDRTVRVWSTRSGDCLATLFVDDLLLDCACAADARSIMAVAESGVYFLRLLL